MIAQLGLPQQAFHEQVMQVLLALLETEDTPEVLASIGVALGHRADARGVEPLLAFQQHADPDVRYGVVFGLLGQTDPHAIACLIALSADSEAYVRDWATFGLAAQIDTDTPALREALYARLRDPDGDTAGEAMIGLARRKDARVVAPLQEALQTGDVGSLPLEAAAALADPLLLPALQQLQTQWSGNQGWPINCWKRPLLPVAYLRPVQAIRQRASASRDTCMNVARLLPSTGTPPAEVILDNALVAGLLCEQHPDLAHLPLQAVDAGWDNALFRLGDDLAVRLPRRALAAPLILHEQRWLPHLSKQLTLPIPAPVRIGTPVLGYPWHWSIVPWLRGEPADQHAPDAAQARPFAAFLRALHVPALADAPANPFRGVPLQQRAAAVEARMQRLASSTSLLTPQVWQIWQAALDAPLDMLPTWLHGDLHPRNVLVEHGIITGIIDWGDITAGDAATDLAALWMLFADPDARQAALDNYGPISDATLQRARGWALMFGVMLLDSGMVDNPRNAAIGARILECVAE